MDGFRPIVLGVVPHQSEVVVRAAARFAAAFHAELVCAHVLAENYEVEELPDGSVRSRPIDPDAPDWSEGAFDQGLLADLPRLLEGVTWSTRVLAGDPASALARLAERVDAELIIVGAPSRAGALSRTISLRLAHLQQRPVVTVPHRGLLESSSVDPIETTSDRV